MGSNRVRYFCLSALMTCALEGQVPCEVRRPVASLSIPYIGSAVEFGSDPGSATWRRAATSVMLKDCSKTIEYPGLKTEIRAFWTDTDLYLLFVCRYRTLNLWLPPDNNQPRPKLWDRDVVEIFLGGDWNNIRHYREFEISPTGDWIDLAIDLDHNGQNHNWRSGWKTTARIDDKARIWYAAAKIPLNSVSEAVVKPGTRWRMNLYRIDGSGPDSQRRFLCWQPTCVMNRDPNHVPENFGTLVFEE